MTCIALNHRWPNSSPSSTFSPRRWPSRSMNTTTYREHINSTSGKVQRKKYDSLWFLRRLLTLIITLRPPSWWEMGFWFLLSSKMPGSNDNAYVGSQTATELATAALGIHVNLSTHAELGHQKAIIVFCLAVHCGLNFYNESVLRKWTFKSVWYNGWQISRSCYKSTAVS